MMKRHCDVCDRVMEAKEATLIEITKFSDTFTFTGPGLTSKTTKHEICDECTKKLVNNLGIK